MWVFKTASDQDGHPLLHSLNDNVGRQTWVWDPSAGTPEQRARADELRRKFAENRLQQKHSADELLRCGTGVAARRRRRQPPPAAATFVPFPAQVCRRPSTTPFAHQTNAAGCNARGSAAAGHSRSTRRVGLQAAPPPPRPSPPPFAMACPFTRACRQRMGTGRGTMEAPCFSCLA